MAKLTQEPSGGFLGGLFLDRLVAHKRGRAFLMNYLQSTEESDEAGVFDLLVELVRDPQLHKLVKVHRADEDRHAAIFAGAVKRQGFESGPVSNDLRVIARLDESLGGYAAKLATGEVGVLEMYGLLLVVEERACREWPAIAKALRKVDPDSADDVERVIADERRHVKYASAVCRKYAPDQETLDRTLAHIRRVEQAVYVEQANAFMRVVIESDLLEVSRLEKVLWRGMSAVGARAPKIAA